MRNFTHANVIKCYELPFSWIQYFGAYERVVKRAGIRDECAFAHRRREFGVH